VRPRTERRKETGHTSKASQEVNGPIVNSGKTVRRSRQLEIRDVGQLIMPPRRVDRSVGSQALVKRMVQVLQGRSDDPRSTSRAGRDLELSGFEVLNDGGGNGGLRSFPGVYVVGGGCSEPERVCGSGSCEGSEKRRKMERWVHAQLEKSSISLFKTIPSEVMIVEPQYKLIAMQMVDIQHSTSFFDDTYS